VVDQLVQAERGHRAHHSQQQQAQGVRLAAADGADGQPQHRQDGHREQPAARDQGEQPAGPAGAGRPG
jgi:hypothetical protein